MCCAGTGRLSLITGPAEKEALEQVVPADDGLLELLGRFNLLGDERRAFAGRETAAARAVASPARRKSIFR